MSMRDFSFFIKRCFDIFFSLIGMLVFFPVFIVISVLIKQDSSGSIFFKQARIGKGGRVFYIYKFRTMIVNAENLDGGLFNYKNDPRVTKIGGFLRSSSLDELPQFINIFFGSMSFVGPRPPVTYELGPYETFSGDLLRRFTVKPGVTGLAQVNGRNELSWDEKICFDSQYITSFHKWGLLLDIWILALTFIKVIKMEGSYESKGNSESDANRMNGFSKKK